MRYDPAGNLAHDVYSGAGNRTYDAENRMTSAADNTGQTSRYTYNADGQRTRRQIAGSQEEWQIYGFDGELLAEYRASSPASSPEKEYGYRNGQLLVTATGRFNVALAANGAVATASSAHTCCGFSTAGAINGNNRGPWGNGEGWNDATESVVPDWIQVEFAGSKTIDEINVFSLHDNYTQENNPTLTQTFSLYGLLAFDVQYWNGSSWVTIPGGSVAGNNKVWRKFTFSPITTTKIRVHINAVPDAWSRVVEIQAFGTSAGGDKVQWLVPDHLGTPRIIVDQTGNRANVKRHDYLPFGEELFAGTGGRTAGLGYASDGVRQQFTEKERDVETGLDYFGARYYASIQGRFTGVDPYDINFERQETNDREEAEALFRDYLFQPQHWNRYVYALNNPLRYVDPDGLMSYEAELLGKKIKIHIDDSILKKDPGALKRIQDNLQKAFDKINAGADKLTKEQKESIGSMKGISVSRSGAIGMSGGTFQITQRMAENPNVDKLSADIIHDSRHAEQAKRGLSYNEKTAIPMEMEASQFTVGVINNIGGWDAKVVKGYEQDAATGHLPNRKWEDKSTPKSRTRVFEKMKGPRN
jgi:RHS repeat-associated protein